MMALETTPPDYREDVAHLLEIALKLAQDNDDKFLAYLLAMPLQECIEKARKD